MINRNILNVIKKIRLIHNFIETVLIISMFTSVNKKISNLNINDFNYFFRLQINMFFNVVSFVFLCQLIKIFILIFIHIYLLMQFLRVLFKNTYNVLFMLYNIFSYNFILIIHVKINYI